MRRRSGRAPGALAALVCAALITTPAAAQVSIDARIDGLRAFFDQNVPRLMKEGGVSGAAFVVVYQGRVVVLRGYGQSRLEIPRVDVDPHETLFRIGSVTKVFTAAAAMQLADSGLLDLRRDVRAYLTDFSIPAGVTPHHLLTHTSGLLERFAGQYTQDALRLQPLEAHLRQFLPASITSPGGAYSYSNYNAAVIGSLIERLSGMSYPDYMAHRLFRPLGMMSTTAEQPPEAPLSHRVARGYRSLEGGQRPIPYSLTQTAPAGGISTTAADMGHFIVALLEPEQAGGNALSARAVRALLAPQYTPDAHIPPHGYELVHWRSHGLELLHKDGTLNDHVAVLLLDPVRRFGMFGVSNAPPLPRTAIGNEILEPLLTYLVGPAKPPATLSPSRSPSSVARVDPYLGSYLDLQHTAGEMADLRVLLPVLQPRVEANPDGSISFQSRRWIEVEPFVLRAENAEDYIALRTNLDSGINEIHAWGKTYRQIAWWQTTRVQLAIPVMCAIAFLAFGIAGLYLRRRMDAGRRNRPVRRILLWSTAVAGLNLAFVGAFPFLFPALGATIPLDAVRTSWLALPIVSGLGALLLLSQILTFLHHSPPRSATVIGCGVSFVTAVFLSFLHFWNLLGGRY